MLISLFHTKRLIRPKHTQQSLFLNQTLYIFCKYILLLPVLLLSLSTVLLQKQLTLNSLIYPFSIITPIFTYYIWCNHPSGKTKYRLLTISFVFSCLFYCVFSTSIPIYHCLIYCSSPFIYILILNDLTLSDSSSKHLSLIAIYQYFIVFLLLLSYLSCTSMFGLAASSELLFLTNIKSWIYLIGISLPSIMYYIFWLFFRSREK
jgi:hypothetical protein